jgi:hypothetical protein
VTGSPQVPEGQLLEIVQTVYQSLPATDPGAVQRERRLLATKWLRGLVDAVHEWNLEFIAVLEKYPGFKESRDPAEYAKFFDDLLAYREQLLTRGGGIKERLCHRLIHLNQRLDKDFSWLKESDSAAFWKLKASSDEAYQNELGVIGLAIHLIAELVDPTSPPASFTDLSPTIHRPGFLDDQIEHSNTVKQIIERYASSSRKIIDQIRTYSISVDASLLPIEDYERREIRDSPNADRSLLEDDRRVVQISNRPQVVNTRLYTILAFCFGVTFLAVLLALTVAIPNPTKAQLRFWIAVLALAAGAVSTVMSGLINVRLSLGKQLVIGATGAFAVFVIIYFQNPAIFQD